MGKGETKIETESKKVKERWRWDFAENSKIICISHFGSRVTLRTRGHDIGWWSFPQRKKSPFPSAHLLQLGQWKSHQGCKSRTMELFALHRQWMIVWPLGQLGTLLHCCSCTVALLQVKMFLPQTQTNALMLFSKGNIYVLSQCLTYPEMEANGLNWYIGQPGVSKCIHIYLICRQKCWKRIQSPNCFSCWWAKGWGGLSETVTKDQSIQRQWNGYFHRNGYFQKV